MLRKLTFNLRFLYYVSDILHRLTMFHNFFDVSMTDDLKALGWLFHGFVFWYGFVVFRFLFSAFFGLVLVLLL